MPNIWVISDTHFGHENIIEFCDRPFHNTHEMNQCILENWNSVVKPQDKIYHLGDVYMGMSKGYIENLLQRLNGHKRLILGNHDNGKDQILHRYFEKIDVWRCFGKEKLLLTHVPVHPSSIEKKEWTNIHGHIHQNKSPEGRYRNACVEWTNYTPVNLEELRIA